MSKLNRRITEKELNEKDDWIITYINHERYTFDIDTYIEENISIKEILEKRMMEDLIQKIERQGYQGFGYVIDEIYHEDKESDTWCLTEKEKERFRPLHIQAITFAKLKDFKKEKYLGTVCGDTNKKFGVMDFAYKPVEMQEQLDKEVNK